MKKFFGIIVVIIFTAIYSFVRKKATNQEKIILLKFELNKIFENNENFKKIKKGKYIRNDSCYFVDIELNNHEIYIKSIDKICIDVNKENFKKENEVSISCEQEIFLEYEIENFNYTLGGVVQDVPIEEIRKEVMGLARSLEY